MRRPRVTQRLLACTAIAATAAVTFTGTASASPGVVPASSPGAFDYSTTTDFAIPGVTFGCGILNVDTSTGTAKPGNNFLLPTLNSDQVKFGLKLPFGEVAALGKSNAPKLTVYWFNLTSFVGGTATLDDSTLGLGDIHNLTKTVKTGEGQIVAAIAGSVNTLVGKTCNVLPTIGLVTTPQQTVK